MFKNITIAGAGTLGSQIAFQTALCDFNVRIWNPHPERAKRRLAALRPFYKKDMGLTDEQFDKAMANILSITNDWEIPFKDCDYLIESVPESLNVKADFYHNVCPHLPEKTIIASNSSTMVPSQLVNYVDRPDKFLHMHFANHIWTNNTAEIVGTDRTKPEVIEDVIEFAKAIKMLPIHMKKEQHGYIMNALSVPFLNAALELWANGVADPITINKDWMNSTGCPFGPFMSMDMVGIRTVYAIFEQQARTPEELKVAKTMKDMIDAGHYGIEAGEGFYKYPNPAFERADFLTSIEAR